MIIKITESTAGQRLDKFLAQYRQDLSRSQIQKLIKQQVVSVNGLLVSPHYNLKAGDVIDIKEKLSEPEETVEKKLPENLPDIKIIDETDEFLVINKPAGLSVHGQADYTLADWLKIKYPRISKVGDDLERPGIVHRLDKDVSGLMIIAKTQAAFDDLKIQFQKRAVKKQYTALVYGKIQKDNGAINFPIKRAQDGYKMAAIPLTIKGELSELGREAETQFQIIKKLINYTLLKITIKTGRTHQIRVHLSAYGNPIVGDNIYATAKTRIQNKKLNLNRIFLIADNLSFTDLTKQKKNYKINLTQELKNILKIVK
jgi:23S rRNA pseudouridine1911/1915/1917 synthase